MIDDIEAQITRTIEKLKPFLQRDGGDIEYYGFKDGIVYVKMGGACEGCFYASSDIEAGVEIILMQEVPGVMKVEPSDNAPADVIKQYQDRIASKSAEQTVAK